MARKTNDFDRLIQGIQSILSENRCSLTDEKISVLEEILVLLEKLKVKKPDNLDTKDILNFIKLGEHLLRFFSSDTFQQFKDLF